MARGFGRLPFLTRRSTSPERRASEHPTIAAASADPDAAPVGPPVLLPASIVRQILFHATELTPAWARPRPEPAPVAVAEQRVSRKRTPRATPSGAAEAGPTKAVTTKAVTTKAPPRRPRESKRPAKGDA